MSRIRPYDHHVFVCTVDNPTCGGQGSERVRRALQHQVRERGLRRSVRVSASGCMSVCAEGPVVVVYPEGVWYRSVEETDVERIVEQHLVGGRPVVGKLLFDLSDHEE